MPEAQIQPVVSVDQVPAKPQIDPNIDLLKVLNQILAMNQPKTDVNQATPDQQAAAKASAEKGGKVVDPAPVAGAKETKTTSSSDIKAALPQAVPLSTIGGTVADAANAAQIAANAGAGGSEGAGGLLKALSGGKTGGSGGDAIKGILKIAALFA